MSHSKTVSQAPSIMTKHFDDDAWPDDLANFLIAGIKLMLTFARKYLSVYHYDVRLDSFAVENIFSY